MRGFSPGADYIKSLTLKQSKDKIGRLWLAPAYCTFSNQSSEAVR